MKKTTLLLFLAFVVVLAAACGGEQVQSTATSLPVFEPTATVGPTSEPTAPAGPTTEPAGEPTAPTPTAEPEPAGDLTANPWLWTSFTSPVEQFDVETPENYVVTFSDDTSAALGASGTVDVTADCNNAGGSYTVDGGSLAIEIGPATMAACPEGSRGEQFVRVLGFAARYFFEDALLYIDLMADGGTMVFAPEGEAALAEAAAAGVDEPAALAGDELRNATYSGIYEQPVTLSDGLWEDEPYTVRYLDGAELYTDLDGDGAVDAVVFLLERGGGTANIIHMAAQLNRAGRPLDAGAVRLDEVAVKSAAAGDGQVQLEVIVMGPGDGDCCPTHKVSTTYAFQDGQWVDLSEGGELVQVSAGDLNGTNWTLLELNYDTPVTADAGVTVDFVDGQISGLGGCNDFNSSFTLGEDNPFVMATSPVVSTMKACPEPVLTQETAYFAALDNVAQWGYEFGRLALYYLDEQRGEYGRLLFAPASTELMADDGEGAMAGAPAKSGLPPAGIANDEGGPATVTGEWNYTAAAVATHYLEPVAVLLDVSSAVLGDYTEWVPRSGQIMGTLTRPLAPAPTAYQVDVPVQPGGASADLDNDGEEDAGVQVYAAVLGTNLAGDSYLEQIEQGGFTSYLSDPQTGAFREGTLLVYAPDEAQGFPGSAGEDGVFFTGDDPAVGLPAGWTLVTLTEDGQVRFDRSRTVTMDILEAAAYASPDFSEQGILESYHSLIDLLSVRYSYTDLRGLDWEQIRQEYLPRVEAADEAGDFAAYYTAMNDLALSIKDAHVFVFTNVPQYKSAVLEQYEEAFGAGLGAQVVELADGRFVVIYLDPEGPAAQAGWQFGTEIVSVDGVPTGERIETLPLGSSAGNPEVIRLDQTQRVLAFPVGTETTIEYRQPGEDELQSVTLTAVEGAFASAPGPAVEDADISFRALDGGLYYVQWKMFRDPLYKVAVWEKFLTQAQGATGILIDMRHNGGGATDLLYTLASYLFTAGEPAAFHWVDDYTYDEKAGDLVKEFANDRTLHSPRPELTFNGAVAVLVGEGSASAAEYLPQFLQRQGRAIVVGEHGTEGAGGYLEQAAMPGDFSFHFTKGRTFFAGTDELNLEAKGVDLDVRVPITLENEQAKQEGRDVVLEAAVVALGEEAARRASEQLPGTTWQLIEMDEVLNSGASNKYPIETPENYTITFGAGGALSIQADCNQAQAEYTLGAGGALTITLGATTLAECPEGSLGEEFLTGLGGAAAFQTDGAQMVITASTEDGLLMMLLTIVESADPAAGEP